MSDSFPHNVVEVVKTAAKQLPDVGGVVKRPIRRIDPTRTLAVFALDWVPVQPPMIGQHDPAIARYLYSLQYLVKHAQEDEGHESHAKASKSLRAMLYRDSDLRVGLGALSESSFGMRERVLQWGISKQRFLSNEIKGTFVFLSTIDLWVEVETV